MKSKRTILATFYASLLAVGVLIPSATNAADSITENFDDTTISPLLFSPPNYVFGSAASPVGSAQYTTTTQTRDFIETVATDYNTVDFVAAVNITVQNGTAYNGASAVAFIGLGGSLGDGDFEPHTSIMFRLFPDNFHDGGLDLTVSSSASFNDRVFGVFSTPPHPGNGTHRVELRKDGDVLTMRVDVDYNGQPFHADYTVVRRMSRDLPFLNDSNSSLFFGVGGTATTFDDFQVTVGPVAPRVDIQLANVSICWESNLDVMYQLEYRSSLTTNEWVASGEPIAGTGANHCLLEPVASPRRFYRLVEVP